MITSFKDQHRFLSNFWPSSVTFNDIVFPSVENAYQAAKFSDRETQLLFVTFTPGQAKRAGKGKQPADWHAKSIPIMTDLVRQKFLIPELRKMLLATGDEEIIEGNTWNDTFWGQCPIGIGENHLGKILMEIRKELKNSD